MSPMPRYPSRRLRHPLALLVVGAVLLASSTVVAAQDLEPVPVDPAPVPGEPPAEGGPGLPADPNAPVDPNAPPAPPPPPPAPMPDPSPRVRVLLASFEILEMEEMVAGEQLKLQATQVDKAAREAELGAAVQGVADAREQLAKAERSFGDYAVEAFMYASGGAAPATQAISLYERKKSAQLVGSVREHQSEVIAQAREQLAAAEAEQTRRQGIVDQAAAVVTQQEAQVQQAQRLLDVARDELGTALDEDLPVMFDKEADRWKLTIMGSNVFTPEELAAWFEERGFESRAAAPIEDLARFYIEEGAAEGVRGDMAFAQAVLETGSFSNQDTILYNNYAGIGHCDSCPTGFQFESPQMGVRGQVQHVKSYADRDAEFANPFVDERLRGPAGCCTTWTDLTGVYATDPNYGAKIMWVYQQMLEWLLPRRIAEAGHAPTP